MNLKLKGSALVAAVGMVFSLSVATPASAAASKVDTYTGTDFVTVEIDLGAQATDLAYRLSKRSGSSFSTVREIPGLTSPMAAGHYTAFITPSAEDIAAGYSQIDIGVGTCAAGLCTVANSDWLAKNKTFVVNAAAPKSAPVATADADGAADGQITLVVSAASTDATSHEYTTDGGSTWAAATVAACVAPYDVTKYCIALSNQSGGGALQIGQPYTAIELRGKNAAGWSKPSDTMSATPYAKPGAPALGAGTTLSYGDGSLTVELAAPAAGNGRDLTGYVWKDGGTNTGEATVAACPLDATKNCITAWGLTNKTPYTGITFAGVNGHGTGAYSAENISGTAAIVCSTISGPTVAFVGTKKVLTTAAKRSLNSYAAKLVESDCAKVGLSAHRINSKSSKTNRSRIALGNARNAVVSAYLVLRGVTQPITGEVVRAKDTKKVVASNSNWAVSYDLQGGTANAAAGSSAYAEGWWITLPGAPTLTGFTFAGWYDAATGGTKLGNAGDNYTPAAPYGDLTVYAQWTPISWTITYNTQGDTTQAAGSYNTGDTITLPAAPSLLGYDFTGWFNAATGGTRLGGAGASYTPSSPWGNLTIYGQWTATRWTVTYNTQGGSLQAAGSYTSTGSFTLPSAPTKVGYDFTGWFDAATGGTMYGATATPTTPWGDKTVYAQWAPHTGWTVTYDYQSPTTAFTGGSTTYNTEGSITLPTGGAKTDYTFGGWWSAASGGTQYTQPSDLTYTPGTPWGNQTLVARWNANRYYQYSNVPAAGIGAGSYSFDWKLMNSPTPSVGSVSVAVNSSKCSITGGGAPGETSMGTVNFDVARSGNKTCVFTFTTTSTVGWAAPTSNTLTINVG